MKPVLKVRPGDQHLCSVYTGYSNKYFLHWDFISSLDYTGFCFVQGSALIGFTPCHIDIDKSFYHKPQISALVITHTHTHI